MDTLVRSRSVLAKILELFYHDMHVCEKNPTKKPKMGRKIFGPKMAQKIRKPKMKKRQH